MALLRDAVDDDDDDEGGKGEGRQWTVAGVTMMPFCGTKCN